MPRKPDHPISVALSHLITAEATLEAYATEKWDGVPTTQAFLQVLGERILSVSKELEEAFPAPK